MIPLLFLLFYAPSCYAYVDPNTGSWLYNLIFPVGVAVAAGWQTIKHGLRQLWAKWRRDDDQT